eukprot:6818140-Ditylum_brightwellii.AAC.1
MKRLADLDPINAYNIDKSTDDGAYSYPGDNEKNYNEYDAIPPYVIHANKYTVTNDSKTISKKSL